MIGLYHCYFRVSPRSSFSLPRIAIHTEQPFGPVDDLWRRARVPSASLVEIADADGFRSSLYLARREALWAIKALRAEPLPLFAAAAARAMAIVPEIIELALALRLMTAGGGWSRITAMSD